MEQLGQQQQSRSALEEQLALMQRPAIVSFPLTPGQVRDFGSNEKAGCSSRSQAGGAKPHC